MKITSLNLRNFRRFRQGRLELGEGINVVKGPNEAGKSTLMQAVLAALFWKADSGRREVRESVTWGESDGFLLELEGEAGGRDFRLVKDFAARSAHLVWGDLETRDHARIEEAVREWLGLGSEAAYRSTAAIRQDEVAAIAAGRDELGRALHAAMTGSDGGAAAPDALGELQRELAELLRGIRGTARNPGPLARVEAEIGEKEARSAELSRAARERLDARRRLEEIDGESAGIETRLETLAALISDSEERADIEEDIEDFHRRYRQLESAAALVAEDARLEEEEERKFGGLRAVLESRRGELEELELKRAGIAEGAGVLERRLREARRARYRPWAPYLLLGGMTLILVGLAGIALSPYMLLASAAGAGLAAAALLPGRYLSFLRRGGELEAVREQMEELERRGAEVERELERIAAAAGCGTVRRFLEMKVAYLQLLARRKEIADKLEVLLPDGERAAVEEEARRLASEVSLRERRLRELRGRTVDSAGLQASLRERDSLRARLSALHEERIRLEVLLGEEDTEEELLRLEEELAYLRERRARLARRAAALELAVAWLERASRETLSGTARRLEEKAGDYISRITDGRYQRVEMDEGSLGIAVWSREKGGLVPPEALSRGTVDQLYLAARLSLAEIICGERRPPLLLDDPFVTFDPRRLERAMRVMRDIARGWQAVIFTCGDHYDAYADRIVELEAAAT